MYDINMSSLLIMGLTPILVIIVAFVLKGHLHRSIIDGCLGLLLLFVGTILLRTDYSKGEPYAELLGSPYLSGFTIAFGIILIIKSLIQLFKEPTSKEE